MEHTVLLLVNEGLRIPTLRLARVEGVRCLAWEDRQPVETLLAAFQATRDWRQSKLPAG